MRIITCNVPKSYLDAIDKLTTKKDRPGIYPSRSELIRVAVREWLINELETAEAFEQLTKSKTNESRHEISTKEVSQTTFYKKISL
ncbi:MAG: ribbon-helix-helix domain-containing protein [Promethearchaeota archaeon]